MSDYYVLIAAAAFGLVFGVPALISVLRERRAPKN